VFDPGSTLAETAERRAQRVVDAAGCYLVPGGVDVHVHIKPPITPEATSSNTFETSTAVAM